MSPRTRSTSSGCGVCAAAMPTHAVTTITATIMNFIAIRACNLQILSLRLEQLGEDSLSTRKRLRGARAVRDGAGHSHAWLQIGWGRIEHHLINPQIKLGVVRRRAHRRRQLLRRAPKVT